MNAEPASNRGQTTEDKEAQKQAQNCIRVSIVIRQSGEIWKRRLQRREKRDLKVDIRAVAKISRVLRFV